MINTIENIRINDHNFDLSHYHEFNIDQISEIVVYGTDWTTETILNQLKRENIDLNPRFQRRDAWKIERKSRFIESLILGLPVPHIVLAEVNKGKYLVLDGKQRLLTILQFYNSSTSHNNNFALKELEFLKEIQSLKYQDIKNNPQYSDYLGALDNQTIRTTIIRNWKNEDFLHKVFLRLNQPNSTLYPQELRQALHPGEFTYFIDDEAIKNKSLSIILNLGNQEPDFRMRDTEILIRYIAFQLFLNNYRGNLKLFLDQTCANLNHNWDHKELEIKQALRQFENAVQLMIEIFGEKNIARIWSREKQKYSSKYNRSILDVMIFYFSDEKIRQSALQKKNEVKTSFENLCSSSDGKFIDSVTKATNTIQNTYTRLELWGKELLNVLDVKFNLPQLVDNSIKFDGLKVQ